MSSGATDVKEVSKPEKSRSSASFTITVFDKHSSDIVDTDDRSRAIEQKKQQPPMMISRGESGVLQWFSFKKGFGFIKVDSTGKDLFVHRTEFLRDGLYDVFYLVGQGYKLEFDIVRRINGLEAVAVTGADGQKVAGFRKTSKNRPAQVEKQPDVKQDKELIKEKASVDQQTDKKALKKKINGRRRRNNKKAAIVQKEMPEQKDEDVKDKFFEKVRRRIQSENVNVEAVEKKDQGRRRVNTVREDGRGDDPVVKAKGKRTRNRGRRARSELKDVGIGATGNPKHDDKRDKDVLDVKNVEAKN